MSDDPDAKLAAEVRERMKKDFVDHVRSRKPKAGPWTPRPIYSELGDFLEVYWKNGDPYGAEAFDGFALQRDMNTREVIGLKVFGVRGLLRQAARPTPPKEAPASEKSAADHLADCHSHLFEGGDVYPGRSPIFRAVQSLLAAVEALEARTRPATSLPPPEEPAFFTPPTPKQHPDGQVGHLEVVFYDPDGTLTSFQGAFDSDPGGFKSATALAKSGWGSYEARVYHRPSGALLWVHRRPAPEAP